MLVVSAADNRDAQSSARTAEEDALDASEGSEALGK